ncbi:MAG: CRISPR-associated endonuclease Cas2 [Firmicutes bacterium]|jgi:CRISPR-associated protein Cas2|nr:CRISPR-associated endonuclease Cas2 [Bacillota bacterium]MDH7494645.1 CRISPR-associated endonuclease Cas2 [Bacillota bacterium]
MEGPALYIISYDVRDDKRRRRVHKTLEAYGYPVQFSVFEAQLRPSELVRLQFELTGKLAAEDSLIYYPLCERCREKVKRVGNTFDPFAAAARMVVAD